ncbi:MAG: ECF transporter S component [Clostridia bacterium]|nr:ECF transporter S component [Clostridia bacterium]
MTMTKTSFSVKKLVMAAVCLALGLYLPFLTGQIPQVGSMLLPMHLPVMLCGFVCGGPLGLVVGAVTPILRSTLFGMPPMYPTAAAMAFELAAYGFITGFLSAKLGHSLKSIYIALVAAMLGGRIVWGIAMAIMMTSSGGAFTFAAFIAGGFTGAVPGIVLQLVAIPAIVAALHKSKLI